MLREASRSLLELFSTSCTQKGLRRARPFTKNFFSKGMPFCHQSCFVEAVVLKKKIFQTKYKYAADLEFFVRMFEQGMYFKKIDMALVFFKSGGTSDLNRFEVLEEWYEILGDKVRLYFFYRQIIEKLKSLFK